MAKISPLLIISVVTLITHCRSHQTVPDEGNRHIRDVIGPSTDHDDPLVTDITGILKSIRDLANLESPRDVRDQVGEINSYVTDTLRAISDVLGELNEKEDISTEVKVHAASLVPAIQTLGFLMGLDMANGDSTRLTIQRISLYVSKFQSNEFRGLYFPNIDGTCVVSVPSSALFPVLDDDVIALSYSVSGVEDIVPTAGNDTMGNDLVAATFLDSTGTELRLTFPDPVFIQMKMATGVNDKQPQCVFMQTADGEFSSWSVSGCETRYPIPGTPDTVHCLCDHLTTFGVMLTEKTDYEHIGVAAWVGCGVVILFCLVTALVFIGHRLMATVRCYIRFSFLTALGLGEILFLCVTYREAPAMCTMIAVAIHFFALASFTWLLSYALFLGNDLSGEVEASLQVVHYTFIGWAIPFVVVLIAFIWRYEDYVHDEYCWISAKYSLRYAYMIPIAIVIVVTVCVLMYDIAVYLTVKDPKKKYTLKVVRSGLRSCCCMLPLVGAVWIMADFLIHMPYLSLQITFSIVNAILVLMKRNIKRKKPKQTAEQHPETTPSGTRKSMQMTMVWGGFSKPRPSTSREQLEMGATAHPVITAPSVDEEGTTSQKYRQISVESSKGESSGKDSEQTTHDDKTLLS